LHNLSEFRTDHEAETQSPRHRTAIPQLALFRRTPRTLFFDWSHLEHVP